MIGHRRTLGHRLLGCLHRLEPNGLVRLAAVTVGGITVDKVRIRLHGFFKFRHKIVSQFRFFLLFQKFIRPIEQFVKVDIVVVGSCHISTSCALGKRFFLIEYWMEGIL